ncbi:MAG TPA: cell division protein FtsQ/DivIB [Burkholderiales bacterium]|nr:cell division protein FtsQ/DivIB [Burkholderiales bacterium]
MWDKTALMNGLAGALYTVAAVLALYVAWTLAGRLPVFALREVRIGGELAHVTRGEIEGVVQRELRGNFLTLDLAATSASFQGLPWVRKASARRLWPARLEVALEEHLPLARWAGAALVNTQGEVFHAAYDGALPVFIGPEGMAREIAIQFRYFRTSLETIGETPVEVWVSPRRAWQLKLASGVTIALGREQVEARLARFVAVHDRTLARLGRRGDYVDLRYSNGFAVRIPELRHEKAEPKRGRQPGQRAG